MRVWMTLDFTLPLPPMLSLDGARQPDARDSGSLARLMHDAYRGTVDDEGESPEDALREAEKVFAGGYGPLDAPDSVVVERAGEFAAATMVVRDATKHATGEAFVAFSFTAPAWHRQGLARAGLVRALDVLARRGERRVHLVVTRVNQPAVRLFESLGFRVNNAMKPIRAESSCE